MTSTTTITTTTTLQPMILGITPIRLLPCQPLSLVLTPPPGHWVYEWHCTPRYSALCVKILALAEELGYTTTELVIPYQDVAGAAAVTESDEDSYVNVQGVAYGIDGKVYARAENDLFFNFRGSTLLPVPGQRTYSVLETYIRLAATMETCEGDAPLMKWVYHRVGSSKDWVPLYHLPFLPRLRLPISDLEGPADYVIRGALVDDSTKVEVYFDVTVEPLPPPIVRLAAPSSASTACNVLLDASESEDPAGGSLHFEWSCVAALNVAAEARAACEASAASQAGGSSLTLLGEALGPGTFNISVVVSVLDQEDRSASAIWASILLVSASDDPSPGAVVAMGPVPEKVSDDRELEFFASVASSNLDACRPAPWASWWLVNVTDDGDVLGNSTLISLTSPTATTATLRLALSSFWSPGPGAYRLRLLLSPSAPGSSYSETLGWSYDSAVFQVDVPPLGGECTIYPTVGNATLTGFRLQSVSWEEEDLPLEHRFSWILRSFPTTTTPGDSRFYQPPSDDGSALSAEDLAATEAWQLLRPWGQDETFAGVVFGVAGIVAVKVEVRDSLGTTNTAEADATVLPLTTALTEEQFVDRLDSSIATGSPFAMLATATALASSLTKSSTTRPSSTITRKLLSTITGSGVFEDPTADLLEQAATTAVKTVVAASMPATANANGTSPIDYYVAQDVIELLNKLSSSGLLLSDGLPLAVSALMAQIVPLVAPAMDQDPTLSSRGLVLTGALLSPEREVLLLQELSEELASSMEVMGDSIAKGLSLGSSSSLDDGLLLVLKESLATAGSDGFSLNNLSVTPGQSFNSLDGSSNSSAGGRRLWSVPESCQDLAAAELAAKHPDASMDTLLVDGDAEAVATLQEVRWPSNVLGFIGTKGSASRVEPPAMLGTHFTRPGVEMVASVEQECCDIVEDALVTLTVRSCGVPLEIGSADVVFDIPVAARASPGAQIAETRTCLRYDAENLAWTGDGCEVLGLSDESVRCSCDQLGTFTAGWATFTTTFTEVVHCNAIDFAGPRTWTTLLPEGEWMVSAHGVTFFLLAWFMLVFPLCSLWRTARRRRREKLSRQWFLCMFETDDEEERDLGFSRKRILLAAERHHRFKFFAKAVWKVLYHHYYFVKPPAEELAMREPRQCLDIARTVELLQETSAQNLGLTSSDAWYLRRCSKMQQLPSKDQEADDMPAKKDPDCGSSTFETELERVERLLLSYRDIVVAARGEFLAASREERFPEMRFWRLFRTFHPLRELLRPSLVERQTFRATAFWMEIWFGVGLLSLLLASSSFLFDVASAPDCGPRSAGSAFFEDLFCALVSALVAKIFVWILHFCHTRHSRKRLTGSLQVWLPSSGLQRRSEDLLFVALATFLGLWGAGVSLGFVAACNEDAGTHWTLAVALYLAVIWFFTPYLLARSRRIVLRRVAKDELAKSMLGEVLESLLTQEDRVDADRIYAYDDNGKPILRPAWLDDMKSGIFGQEKAGETFDQWVSAEAKTGSLSRAPTIFLEAEAASLNNTLAIATAESPKPPAMLPPPLDGTWALTLSTLVPPAGPMPGSPPARPSESWSPGGRRHSGVSILSSVASVGRITLHSASSVDDLSVSSFGDSRPSPILWDEDSSFNDANNNSNSNNGNDGNSNSNSGQNEPGGEEGDSPGNGGGIRVEIARSCFQQWAEEWSRMQHSELCERKVKLSRGTTCTLDQSPTHNRGFEKRVERAQLLKEGFKATIVDGREPVAFRNTAPSPTPLWVSEWWAPSSAIPASPMSSWAALSYRSSPSQSPSPSLSRSRTAMSPLGSTRSSPSHRRRG